MIQKNGKLYDPKNGKLYDPKNENLYGYNHWILHSRARAGSGSDREAIGEGPHTHSVGSFTNEVK